MRKFLYLLPVLPFLIWAVVVYDRAANSATGISGSPPNTGISGHTPSVDSGGGGGDGGPTFPATNINIVADYGAKGDSKSARDGIIAANSTLLTSAVSNFTADDVGKPIVLQHAGVAHATLTTTIAQVVNSNAVVLGTAATESINYKSVKIAQPSALGTGYVAGDSMTTTGGSDVTTPATFTLYSTQPVLTVDSDDVTILSPSVVAGGTGGRTASGATDGTCSVDGTTGSGAPKFQITVAITGGIVTAINPNGPFQGTPFTKRGIYYTNPTTPSAEPVTGCNGLTGAILNVEMGIHNLRNIDTGVYGSGNTGSTITGGSGTGAAAGLTYTDPFIFTYGTDDTAAFISAMTDSNTSNRAGTPTCIYIPAGFYFLSSTLPVWSSNGCIIGEGTWKTTLYISPSLSGDVFAWNNAWQLGEDPGAWEFNGSTVNISTNVTGPRVEHFTILGDRTATNQQNAFVWYGLTNYVSMTDIDVLYLHGRCIWTGAPYAGNTRGITTESRFAYIRCRATGIWQDSIPGVQITASDNATVFDELNFDHIDIYAPQSEGFVIDAPNVSGTATSMNVTHLRIEGTEWNPDGIQGDLLRLGSTDGPTSAGSLGVNNIKFSHIALLDPYVGYAALRLTGPDITHQPFQNHFDNLQIGGGLPYGKGIIIDAGRSNQFNLTSLFTRDTNITIGNSGFVTQRTSGGNLINGFGAEQAYTYDILGGLSFYTSFTYPTLNGTGAVDGHVNFTANPHNSTAEGGNPLPGGAVDLQLTRVKSTQVAAGVSSVIAGGSFNIVTGAESAIGGGESNSIDTGIHTTISGGFNNTLAGSNSWSPGGARASDNDRIGVGCWASSRFISNGDAQACNHVLRCLVTSTSDCLLTADQGLVGTSNNCVNVAAAKTMGLNISVIARNRSNGTSYQYWSNWPVVITRGVSAASTAVSAGTKPTPITNGTVAGSDITAAADTTNGCLALTFTPPTANISSWHIVATVSSVEVQ